MIQFAITISMIAICLINKRLKLNLQILLGRKKTVLYYIDKSVYIYQIKTKLTQQQLVVAK